MDEDEGGWLPLSRGALPLEARGLGCEMKWACCCWDMRGVEECIAGVEGKEDEKRSATWFATTMAILCLLARFLSKAPSRTNSALRVAILEPCEPCRSNSALKLAATESSTSSPISCLSSNTGTWYSRM